MTTPGAHPRAALPEQKQRPGSDFQHAKSVTISTQHPRAGSNFLPSIVEPDSTVQTTAGLNRSPAFKQPTFPKKRSQPVIPIFRPAKSSTPPSVESRAGSTFPTGQPMNDTQVRAAGGEPNRVPDPPNDKRRQALADLRVGDTLKTPQTLRQLANNHTTTSVWGQTTGTPKSQR
jgi:hypothetical protein